MCSTSYRHNQKGLGMVEVIVVVAVILVGFTAVLELFRLQFRNDTTAREDVRAYALLSEAMEAVRSVRDDNWSNISGLTQGADYYPAISGNAWVLSGADPGPIDGYSRWIVFSSVRRDANDDIVDSGGSVDADTLKVTGSIEWQSGGQTKTKTLITYLTNWHAKL